MLVDVRVPGSLDDRQRELLLELSRSFDDSNNGRSSGDEEDKGIFEKIKEALG